MAEQILILLPSRNLALRAVLRLCQLAQRETRADSVQNKDRLLREFNPPELEDAVEGGGPGDGSAKTGTAAASGKRVRVGLKAAPHAAVLEDNTDDHFRLGIKITRSDLLTAHHPLP